MLDKVIKHRRGILYTRKTIAYIKDWELIFNCPGVNKYEPAFANICPTQGSKVEGVAYSMSQKEFDKLLSTEAGMYDVVEVDTSLDNGETTRSYTLVSKKTIRPAPPSYRYLSLIIEGAKENDLSNNYINRLNTISHAPKPPGYNFVCKLVSLYLYAKFYILKHKN